MRSTLVTVMLGFAAVAGFEPRITNVAPQNLAVSAKAQVLTVTGEEFRSGLSLHLTTPGGEVRTHSGADITTPKATSFQVAVVLDAEGRYEIVVVNPDGATSSPYPFQVKAGAARQQQPTIDTVTPRELTKNREPQTVTLAGRNFAAGLKISVTDPTGTVMAVDVVDKVSPTAVVFRFAFTQTGQYEVLVTNPGGESSNVVTISVAG
jgi:hypothetical protein